MKRLLGYLFIVLGLGLAFNVNAEAKVYCVEVLINERINDFDKSYVNNENQFFYNSNGGGACIESFMTVTKTRYDLLLNLFSKQELKFKKEPSQTQKVAKKVYFCDYSHGVQISTKEGYCDLWGGKKISKSRFVEIWLNPPSRYTMLNYKTPDERVKQLASYNNRYKLNIDLTLEKNTKTQIAKVEPSQTQEVVKKKVLQKENAWVVIFKHKKTKEPFIGISNKTKKIAITDGLAKCYAYATRELNKTGYGDCLIDFVGQGEDTTEYLVKLFSLGYDINKYELSDKFKKKIISIKIKNEELAYSNNLPKYLSKLYRGGNLDKFYLEKSTLNRIIEDKKKIEEKDIQKYIDLLYSGKKLDDLFLEKITISKVFNSKIKIEEENINKYIKADVDKKDLTKFNIEKETIELVSFLRQERKKKYVSTCTGWVFGHKKGTYEWFK